MAKLETNIGILRINYNDVLENIFNGRVSKTPEMNLYKICVGTLDKKIIYTYVLEICALVRQLQQLEIYVDKSITYVEPKY